jgi:hypothetical protein
MMPEDRKNGSCGNIMYKTIGVYVFIVNPFPVAGILTADNNDARMPLSFHTCGRCRKTQEKTFGSGLGVYDKKIFKKWL